MASVLLAAVSTWACAPAQEAPGVIEVALDGEGHRAVDATVLAMEDEEREAIELVPREEGKQQLLVLDGVELVTGVIEFDVLAEASRRFVGMAWHVGPDERHEALYFRPFRFQDPDPVGRRRAVQYVSHPEYPWRRLRQEFPDVYEAACPVKPGGWISVRLEVERRAVRVFVAGVDEAVLEVERPFVAPGTGVALWTGVGTRGAFANVRVTPSDAGSGEVKAPVTAVEEAEGKPVDLLATLDVDEAALAGEWRLVDGELRCGSGAFARAVVARGVPQSYDIDVAFTRSPGGDGSVSVLLPVGKSSVAVQLGTRGELDGIGLIGGRPAWESEPARPTLVKEGERFEASVRVRSDGERARIGVVVGGKPHLGWEGAVGSLELFGRHRIPPGTVGVGAHNTEVAFHSIGLRGVATGEADE